MKALAEATGRPKDVALIGQFGVGFYSAFMVADKVEVTSRRKAGEDEAWPGNPTARASSPWRRPSVPAAAPTIVLHIRKDAEEFLEPSRLQPRSSANIPTTSPCPISLSTATARTRRSTRRAALWTRAKSEITRGAVHRVLPPRRARLRRALGDAALRAEGKIEYTGLLFIPGVEAVRSVPSRPQAVAEALCAAGVHHR